MSAQTNQPSMIAQTLYKARVNILEQLESQEYKCDDYKNFSIHDVHLMDIHSQSDMLLKTEQGTTVYVKFYLNKTLRPQQINEMIEDLYHLDQMLTVNDTLIIIIKDKPNETMIQLINQLFAEENIFVNIRNIQSLQFNVLTHSAVPTHIILSSEERTEFEQTFNIMNSSQIPEISRHDPVSKAICLRPDTICRIERSSKTSIRGEYFRICVNK